MMIENLMIVSTLMMMKDLGTLTHSWESAGPNKAVKEMNHLRGAELMLLKILLEREMEAKLKLQAQRQTRTLDKAEIAPI